MLYCRKCSRLLESDLSKCPYCGNEESDDIVLEDQSKSEIDIQFEELNKIAGEMKEKSKNADMPLEPQLDRDIYAQTPLPDPSPRHTPPPVVSDTISIGAKILYILLSIFVVPAGIAVGAVFMGKDSLQYKSMGKTMLIISISVIAASVICCCALFGLSAFAIRDGYYF